MPSEESGPGPQPEAQPEPYVHPHLPVDPDRDGADEQIPGRPPVEHWDVALVVAAGGALGGLARYAVNRLLGPAAEFPWATFAENVLGCLLLGAVMVVLVELRGPSRYARPFLGVGVLGGFTTFSAYTSDTRSLLDTGHTGTALLYLAGSVVAGVLATVVGIAAARRVAGTAANPQAAEEAA